MADLSVDLGFLKLRNPVLTASGTFGYGLEFAPFIDLAAWAGSWSRGSITGRARETRRRGSSRRRPA